MNCCCVLFVYIHMYVHMYYYMDVCLHFSSDWTRCSQMPSLAIIN